MSVTDWMVAAYCILFCLVWCVTYARAVHTILAIPLFEDRDPPIPKTWPKLSIVIAARNEAGTMRKALSTLLEQDYPDLELVLVDDRSTDRTGEILENIAAEDSRVKVVHVEQLPAKWLGKVHALHVGTQKTSGEWILYTDADVHFRQGTLRKAVALALAEEYDHLALLPKVNTDSFWLTVVIRAFGLWFLQTIKAAKVGKAGSDAFIGIGAFNMVKKSALDKTEGFSWLRMEVADDMGLGLMLKRAGAKSGFAAALRHVNVTWYPSIRAMFRGSEKGGALYGFARVLGMSIFIWAVALAPAVAILYSGVPYLWTTGAAACVFLAVHALVWKRKVGEKGFPSLFIPIGQLVLSFMMVRSVMLCKLRGGIVWRGEKYGIEDLRAGRRLRL